MQIDFHHTATYAIARLAGFGDADASTIASSAQYVDDATTSGALRFDIGLRYWRDATAHPTLDARNLDNDLAVTSWLPFHFLPGNDGLDATHPAPLDAGFGRRLVCRADSFVARAMMDDVIAAKARPHALHRLGIAAHVFVDTFAHQGFVGERDAFNDVEEGIRALDGRALRRMPVPPIGHGQVGTCPDRPFLKWRYVRSHDGGEVVRDNPALFVAAADRLCQEFRRYLADDPARPVAGLGDATKAKFETLFTRFTDDDGDVRHAGWLEALAADHFGFGAARPEPYVGKGPGSWKHRALGPQYLGWLDTVAATLQAEEAKGRPSTFQRIGAAALRAAHETAEAMSAHIELEPHVFTFRTCFLTSDYKRFHDAAGDQRVAVLRHILPRFGIIVA